MLACRHGSPLRSLRHIPRTTSSSRLVKRRHFTAGLTEGFLDLALALPLPPSWPVYSSTIILITVATRLVFTVPFSIWAKKRQWRGEELVVPALKESKPLIEKDVVRAMRLENLRGTKDDLRQAFRERMKKAMTARRDELYAEHRCRPLPTMLIPPVTQLPLFVVTSMMFTRAAQAPTPLDSESFLTLTSLAHADPTVTLPIVLGILTLANVESSNWFVTEAGRAREALERANVAAKRAEGKMVLEPRKILQSGMRMLSVGRILIGAMVPGSVIVYWVTSAAFGLVQSWAFDYWERRRVAKRLLQLEKPVSAPTTSVAKKARRQPS
ncbi:60Kd inner membrane protein-domain-containing protein [Amylostereum chailletii]|nr:60Kd inner membrane protein-domain-containing protein [Amylostereum chailletii]